MSEAPPTEPEESVMDTSIEEGLCLFSCTYCNKLHRKCDRRLPSCSECIKRSKDCVYEKPKRIRRRKSKDVRASFDTPFTKTLKFHHINIPVSDTGTPIDVANIVPPTTFNKTVASLPKEQITISPEAQMEECFENIYFNIPYFSASDRETLYKYRQIDINTNLSQFTEKQLKLLSIIFAIKAFFHHRLGHNDLSKKALEITLKIVGSIHYTATSSLSTACCFTYLALIYGDMNDTDKLYYYSHNIRGYLRRSELTSVEIESVAQRSLREVKTQYLRTLYHLGVYHSSCINDMCRLFKILLCLHLLTKQHRLICDVVNQPTRQGENVSMIGFNPQDEEFCRFLPLIDVIRYDLDNYKSTMPLTTDMLDILTSRTKQTLAEPTDVSGADLYSRRMGFYIVCHGAKLQCLRASGLEAYQMTREVASYILELASSPSFHYCHRTAVAAVAASVSYFLALLESQQSSTQASQMAVMNSIQSGVTIMNNMCIKYPVIAMNYGEILKAAASVLDQYHKVQIPKSVLETRLNVAPFENILIHGTQDSMICSDPSPVVQGSDIETLLHQFFLEKDSKQELRRSIGTPTPHDLFL
ncbi:hypothetical protein AKO1_011879 [Acrasis kona]|uniref:Zn(2)-C6 fungal-type domain-containing protein n=1 Tax=Acrasis kona TaxID=1008807 RepID=A0AAW2Z5D0_9EUKA